MKINLKPAHLRLLVNLFSLLGIGFFFVLSPVIGKVPGPVKPMVKAAFVSEP
ncbi:MAG: hypothetical protein ACD_61C00169G0001, partial [uncultured bacterium]